MVPEVAKAPELEFVNQRKELKVDAVNPGENSSNKRSIEKRKWVKIADEVNGKNSCNQDNKQYDIFRA